MMQEENTLFLIFFFSFFFFAGMFMVISRVYDRYGVITQESSRAVSWADIAGSRKMLWFLGTDYMHTDADGLVWGEGWGGGVLPALLLHPLLHWLMISANENHARILAVSSMSNLIAELSFLTMWDTAYCVW